MNIPTWIHVGPRISTHSFPRLSLDTMLWHAPFAYRPLAAEILSMTIETDRQSVSISTIPVTRCVTAKQCVPCARRAKRTKGRRLGLRLLASSHALQYPSQLIQSSWKWRSIWTRGTTQCKTKTQQSLWRQLLRFINSILFLTEGIHKYGPHRFTVVLVYIYSDSNTQQDGVIWDKIHLSNFLYKCFIKHTNHVILVIIRIQSRNECDWKGVCLRQWLLRPTNSFRNYQFLSYSKIPHLMEPDGSLPLTMFTTALNLSLSYTTSSQLLSARSILILPSHQSPGHQIRLLHSCFYSKTLRLFSFSPMCAVCSAHLALPNFIPLTTSVEQHISRSSQLYTSLHSPLTSLIGQLNQSLDMHVKCG